MKWPLVASGQICPQKKKKTAVNKPRQTETITELHHPLTHCSKQTKEIARR